MTLTRRRLLQSGAVAGGALLFPTRRARAFGDFPSSQADLMLPTTTRAKRVLEVFLYGGLSPWETLYYVDAYGAPGTTYAGTQSHTFRIAGGNGLNASLSRCGYDLGASLGAYFADDADGVPVSLGPYMMPLRARTDVTSRMRIFVQQHELEPHEAAIPLGLTGRRVGAPSLAGLGTHIQRALLATGDVERSAPYSYVFFTGGLSSDNVQAAFATGLHPGSARPLSINVDNVGRLAALFARPAAGDAAERARFDALLAHAHDRYRSRLIHPGRADPLRAPRVDALSVAQRAVADVDDVASLFPSELFDALPETVCTDSAANNAPKMSMRLAAHLLTHPVEPAAYACVVDTGLLEAAGGGGYDTHETHARDTARNLKNLLDALLEVINAPGENDPQKLDLDDTLIVLNTEFGRTPWAQDGGSGRNHHPGGYTTAMIGGPIQTGAHGIVGAIGEDGYATSSVLPAETRIAALLAMGIFPFAPEAFGLSDVGGAGTEPDAIVSVTQRLLGVQL